MRYRYFFYLAIGLTVLACHANEQNDEQEKQWERYLETLDPYANPSDENEKHTDPLPHTPQKQQRPPDPPPIDATAREVSEHNRNQQRALRKRQRDEVERLLEHIEQQPDNRKSAPRADVDFFTLPSTNQPQLKGYKARETHFDWGGKQSNYQYIDYEFVFESTDPGHAEKISQTMTEMTKAGWEVDLNRSFQTVETTDEKPRAFTTMQMRFRRRR